LKNDCRPGETEINRERKRRNGTDGFTAPNEMKGASEVPRTPIKVGIVGFANINPTSRRRVGGRKQRVEQAFMNGAGWELGVRGRTAGFWAAWLVRRLEGNANHWRKKAWIKEGKTGDAEEVLIAEMKSKTASEMSSPRKEAQKTEEVTLATAEKSWQVKCHSVDKGRRGGVWHPWGILKIEKWSPRGGGKKRRKLRRWGKEKCP
jgi:hypothetical protein